MTAVAPLPTRNPAAETPIITGKVSPITPTPTGPNAIPRKIASTMLYTEKDMIAAMIGKVILANNLSMGSVPSLCAANCFDRGNFHIYELGGFTHCNSSSLKQQYICSNCLEKDFQIEEI